MKRDVKTMIFNLDDLSGGGVAPKVNALRGRGLTVARR